MKSITSYILENQEHANVIENHIEKQIPINESYLRIDSDSYAELLVSARSMFESGKWAPTTENEKIILEKLDSGKKAIFIMDGGKRKEVKLHIPMPNPNRTTDGKRFIVYIQGAKTDKETDLPIAKELKFASWGDNLDINNDDPEAVKSFWARQQCDTKKDVNTAGYWACYAPELFGGMLKLRGGKERW